MSLEEIAERSRQLTAELRESKYNCDCQIGGVDAMSVDSDWLGEVAEAFSKAVELLKGENK